MVRYSVEPEVPEKTSKSRGSHLRVHFKHCRELAHTTKGMTVPKALKYLDDVARALSFDLLFGLVRAIPTFFLFFARGRKKQKTFLVENKHLNDRPAEGGA